MDWLPQANGENFSTCAQTALKIFFSDVASRQSGHR